MYRVLKKHISDIQPSPKSVLIPPCNNKHKTDVSGTSKTVSENATNIMEITKNEVFDTASEYYH